MKVCSDAVTRPQARRAVRGGLLLTMACLHAVAATLLGQLSSCWSTCCREPTKPQSQSHSATCSESSSAACIGCDDGDSESSELMKPFGRLIFEIEKLFVTIINQDELTSTTSLKVLHCCRQWRAGETRKDEGGWRPWCRRSALRSGCSSARKTKMRTSTSRSSLRGGGHRTARGAALGARRQRAPSWARP